MKSHKEIKKLAKEYSDALFGRYSPDAVLDPEISFYSGFQLGYQQAYDEVNYGKSKDQDEVLEKASGKKRRVRKSGE